MRLMILLSATLAMASSAGLIGCGGDDTDTTGSGDAACFDYSSFNAMSPTVSFSTDVLPIFRTSCGLSGSCHGSQTGPVSQPYLGPANSAGMPSSTDIDAIFAANVNVASSKDPAMKIVAPGSPENSFLMHKTDNTLKCDAVKCGTACGGSMPLLSPTLPQDQRDTIRRWIAQGAKND